MVYTHKHPALLIIAVIMLGIGISTSMGLMNGVIDYLHLKKVAGEMETMSLAFGAIALIVGLWHQFGRHDKGSQLDYYGSTIAGAMFILLIAMLIKWFVAPEVAVISKSLGKVGDTGKYLHTLMGLNYVVLGIVAGIVVVNVFRVPKWAENGVRLSRLGLKTGVILLGLPITHK